MEARSLWKARLRFPSPPPPRPSFGYGVRYCKAWPLCLKAVEGCARRERAEEVMGSEDAQRKCLEQLPR